MRTLALFGLTLLLVAPAMAAQTPWQELAPGVRVRMISSDVRQDGKTLAGLELDMPRTTRTYWRIPGESGIAAEFDLSASSGITGHEVLWPYPVIDTSQGYLDYAYFGPTVLPLQLLLPGDSAMLVASITLGICSDVCLPARATFSLPLSFLKPDAGQGVRLGQALSGVPIAWDRAQPPLGAVGFDAAANALTIAGLAPGIDPASLIADAGDPAILFGTPKKSPDGQLVLLPLLGGSDGTGLEGKPVQLTFMTAMGPYAVSRQVGF